MSDIEALWALVRALRKPLRAVFVTDPHPDHFNGVAALAGDEGVPIYVGSSVAGVIGEIADATRAQWGPVYGEKWRPELSVIFASVMATIVVLRKP